MPLYEYRCDECGALLTVRQSFSDDSTPFCGACDDRPMRRIISSVSVVKSERERVSDLSWVDKNLAGRIKKKASSKLSPALQQAVDRMESH
ncbi:MAG: zinc ribbon domain-containing protein [Anaerolineae bacterium]|jgi:putative FmdB family regulatory protein